MSGNNFNSSSNYSSNSGKRPMPMRQGNSLGVLVIASTPLGVAAIFIGAYLSFQAIGTGLILGGVLTVAWGHWNYWLYLDDWIRFISLLAGFAILIFIGVRRIGIAKSP